jgi:alkylation response protein AidB-like acyl-CoA dehydrogenase
MRGGRQGFTFLEDWDNIGQRLTDSGGVRVVDARIEHREVLGEEPFTGGVS